MLGFPVAGTPVAPTGCGTPNQTPPFTTFYNCPVGLGAVNKTIGGPRQVQMGLHLIFLLQVRAESEAQRGRAKLR